MKNLFIVMNIIISMSNTVIAQEKSVKELQGDKFAFVYSFDKAIDAYTHAKKLTPEGQRNLAVSYHNLNQHAESEAAYAKLLTNTEEIIPEDYYNYAMVLKTNGKHSEAGKWMAKFKEQKPGDLRVKSYEANATELANLLKDEERYKIEHLDVNTDAADFGTSYYKDKIVFSSSRTKPKLTENTYNWNGKPFLDMYMSDVEGNQLKTPVIFDKNLNDKMHDGTASFSEDGNHMAFTCNNHEVKRKDVYVKLQIFFSDYKDGQWSKMQPFFLNNKDYSVGHPCLSADGNTMYFSSDMPGGYGGADIYRITKDEKGEWKKPENLGNKINTEGDEMFPFYEEHAALLLFASNGHFGLGGLDVFSCAGSGVKFGTVYNAGSPLNTPYDDFGLIINKDADKGYFSSNRPGGSGDDDIYFVEIKSLRVGKKIKGIAKDINENHIPTSFVTLLDESGKVIDSMLTKEDGAYVFLVDPNKNFKLVGKKQDYIDGDTLVNTFGKPLVVKADVILRTKEEIIAEKIQPGADLAEIIELNPIYFDLDKYTIRPDAQIELDKIVKIMNRYPEMIVELGSHTDCRATQGYNQVLSNRRAKASAAYIKKRITNPARIYGKGYGETKLVNNCSGEGNVVSDCTEDEHQKNRRTEFIVVKK